MTKIKPIFTKIIVIVHGKSEYELASYIKSNLRIKLEVASERKGRGSIQINGLMNILNNTDFKNKYNLAKKYNIELDGRDRIKNLIVFPIMDTDDCTYDNANNYKDKTMFKGHWLYDYILPVYNITNLEDVLKKSGVPYETKNKGNYINIFPINRGQADIEQIKEFSKKISLASDISNLHLFVDKCILIQEEYPIF